MTGYGYRWGVRFSPHVLVLPIALVLSVPVLRGAIATAIFWWHEDTYAERTFVMDEFHSNEGSPYISGHFEGDTEVRGVLGAERDGRQVVAAAPDIVFEPGGTLRVWHSDSAPLAVVFGREVNDVPVATLPVRPGLPSLLSYLVGLAMVACAALWTTQWVYHRFSRRWGPLRIGRPEFDPPGSGGHHNP